MKQTSAEVLRPPPVSVQTVIDVVTERMRADIVSGELPPGEKLIERKLAAAYGVSTIAVRDAFARLSEEGIVRRVPRRGTFVSELSAEGLRDLTRVRIVLEQLAVELAMTHWTPALEASLRKIVAEMREAGKAGDAQRLLELDLAFHRTFVDAADSEALSEVLTRLSSRVEHFLRRANSTLPAKAARTIGRVHEELLDAIASGSVKRAMAAVEKHIATSCDELVRRLDLPVEV
jgi:DNA-binding GntR family transcriptional regulator